METKSLRKQNKTFHKNEQFFKKSEYKDIILFADSIVSSLCGGWEQEDFKAGGRKRLCPFP